MRRVPLATCCCLFVTLVASTGALLFLAYSDKADYDTWGYCESPKGQEPWVAQPANTLSNLGFVIVGLLMALACDYEFPRSYWRGETRRENLLTGHIGYGALWSSLMCLTGPAATAFHATFTSVGVYFDQASILADASFLAVYCLVRKRRRFPFTTYLMIFSILAVAMVLLSFLTTNDDPKTAAMALLLAVSGFTEIWYKMATKLKPPSSSDNGENPSPCCFRITNDHADIRWLVLCLSCLAVGATMLYIPVCSPDSLFQTHAFWHVLCAIMTGFIFLYELSVHEDTWCLDTNKEQEEGIIASEKGGEEVVVAVEPDSKV